MTDTERAPRHWQPNRVLARLAFGGDSDVPHEPGDDEVTALDLDDPGQRSLGEYELLEWIGQGGMGVVYRARQNRLKREVALKLLSAGPWASDQFVARFQQEAQHAARLQHPNIVTVYEIGEHRGLIYYAMEFVPGISLDLRLQRDGPMSPQAAAILLLNVAEAVDYAHRLGVLHLDLKPGNVLIAADGTAKIADFGLARQFDRDGGVVNDRVSGTPGYIAPEQAEVGADKLDRTTDVWGLGTILYEALTGEPPFAADSSRNAFDEVRHATLRAPGELRHGIPADLDAICRHCLRKQQHERYPSARAVADDLRRFLDGRPVSVRPLHLWQRCARWMRRDPRLAAAGALAAVALVAGIATTTLQWQRAESNAAAASARLWEGRREGALRAAADGHGLDAMHQLLQNIQEEESGGRQRLGERDRRHLGMLLAQGAVLIDSLAIADANPLAVALSDDGSRLAIAFNDRSVRWYDTATLGELGRADLADRVASDGRPRSILLLRFAGNQRLIATLEWYANLASPANTDSWLIDLDRAAVVEPPAAFADFADAAFAEDGRFAMLRNHRDQMQLWQVAPWRPISALREPVPNSRGEHRPMMVGPGAGYATRLNIAMRELVVLRPPELGARMATFPGNAGISAWAHSHDGRLMALGDYEGRVFLLDPRTLAMRTLPTTRGREVTWVEFSEDDRWLAAGRHDGTAYVFDAQTGDSLNAGLMQHDFIVQRIAISRSHRLVIASGEGMSALWRLPDSAGPRALPAQRIGIAPAPHGSAGRYAVAWSLQAGLLASAGIDGQVRLWRLPRPGMPSAIAARQLPEKTWFDGTRLVDVEWNRLRIVSVAGQALTPWIELAQPPGFAELIDDGRTLVVTVGPQLRVYDSQTLRLRFAPVALPETPQRLLPSNDASRLLVALAHRGAAGFQNRLWLYDLRNGRRLPGEAVLSAPLRTLAFAADDLRILAVGPADGATVVLHRDGLGTIGEFPHDPFQPVLWADFQAGRDDIWLVTHADDPRLGTDLLISWEPRSDTVRSRTSTGQARPIGVIGTPQGGAFVAGTAQDQLHTTDGVRNLARTANNTATAVLALSPDRRLVAHAHLHHVVLFDSASGSVIGPPLHGESNAMDVITRLAFAADGKRLLARTLQGRWMVWPIAPEQQPVKEIATQIARLGIDNESPQRAPASTASIRAVQRARDPGPWPAPDSRPTLEPARLTRDGFAIPLRGTASGPLQLDLTQAYNRAPDGIRNTFFSVRSQMRPYPAGVQRIAGIDYDMRGMSEVGAIDSDSASVEMRCAAVPAVPVAAVHVLLTPVLVAPVAGELATVAVRLHYRDGGQAVLPLRTQVEVPGYNGHDEGVPYVFGPALATTVLGLPSETLVAPRLANPEPARLVRCLEVLPLTGREPVLLYAITVEPAAQVIPAAVSRTDRLPQP